MAQKGGARPGAGRPPGRPNKVALEVRELAREYTQKSVLALARVLDDPEAPHVAVVKAAEALLDRGHGRPTQHIEARVGPLDMLSEQQLLAAARAIRAALVIDGDATVIDDDDEQSMGETMGDRPRLISRSHW